MVSLDSKLQNADNRSRHEKARLEKAIARLANARTPAAIESVRKAFPDLLSADLERIRETSLALRGAWNLDYPHLRRVVLLDQVGRDFREKHGSGLAALMGAFRHRFRRRIETTHGVESDGRYHSMAELHAPMLENWENELSQDGLFRLLMEAHDSRHKMRVCDNPHCPHPYYLRSEGGKMFCSKACAAPSQRAHKLKWWNHHKKELLARRRAEYRKRTKRASRRKPRQRKS